MEIGPVPRRAVWPRSRRGVIVDDLNELHGPTSGVIELPHRMFWQPDRRVDLDNPALLRWMYETVLREAVTVEELRSWLDGPTLVRVWRDLYIPRPIRYLWESQYPDLQRAAA
jgi:hypothetical protein